MRITSLSKSAAVAAIVVALAIAPAMAASSGSGSSSGSQSSSSGSKGSGSSKKQKKKIKNACGTIVNAAIHASNAAKKSDTPTINSHNPKVHTKGLHKCLAGLMNPGVGFNLGLPRHFFSNLENQVCHVGTSQVNNIESTVGAQLTGPVGNGILNGGTYMNGSGGVSFHKHSTSGTAAGVLTRPLQNLGSQAAGKAGQALSPAQQAQSKANNAAQNAINNIWSGVN